MNKIGFACKFVYPDRSLPLKQINEIERQYNMKSTTVKWLRDNKKQAHGKLEEICLYNAQCILNLVSMVSSWPVSLRMVRIGSDVLPVYTHAEFRDFYKKAKFMDKVESLLSEAGHIARTKNVKLSMHPGQFCVLASDKPHVLTNSIAEFEYHVDLIRMMGFGKSKLDFKCNVHLSGAGGAETFKQTYKKLSNEARRVITLENDEFSSDLNDLLPLSKLVGIVLDLHHYWVYNEKYIESNDPRLKIIEDSWQGVTPTIHYSYSREDYVSDVFGQRPDMRTLLSHGIPKTKLRAHSDFYPNATVNRYVLSFLKRFDIMCEAKAKNLASWQLYAQAQQVKYL